MSDWLEHRLIERFDSMQHPFDAEVAWQQLEQRRKKRKRGIAWWWYAGVGLALLFVVLGLWRAANPASVQPHEANQVIAHTQQPAQELPSSGLTPPVSAQPAPPYSPKNRITPKEDSEQGPVKVAAHLGIPKEEFSRADSPIRRDIQELSPLPTRQSFISRSVPMVQARQDNEANAEISLTAPPPPQKQKLPSGFNFSGGYGIIQATTNPNQAPASQVAGVDHWHTTLGYRRSLSDQLWVEAGIVYRQFTTRESGQDTTFRSETKENQLIQIIQYPDGTTEEIYGPLDVTIREITERLHWQVHPSLELQVLAGYQLAVGEKWYWSIGTGVSWGYMLPRRGIAQNPLAPGNWQVLASLPYRSTTPFRWIGATDVGYQWNETWGVFLGIQGGMDLNNQWQTSTPDAQGSPDQRFKWGTGTLGIRFAGFK